MSGLGQREVDVGRTERSRSIGWSFWSQWVLASVLGAAVGWGTSSTVYLLLGLTEDAVARVPAKVAMFAADGVALGVGVGAAQFLVLRVHLDGAGRWVLATAVGYGAGFALTGLLEKAISEAFGAFVGYALTALAIGLLPWLLVLRGRVARSGWWILANAVGFYLGVFAAIASVPLVTSSLGLARPSNLGQSVAGIGYAMVIAAVIALFLGLTTASAFVLLTRRTNSPA
jgi:hypothetical protein